MGRRKCEVIGHLRQRRSSGAVVSEGARRNAALSFHGDATRKRRVGLTVGNRPKVRFSGQSHRRAEGCDLNEVCPRQSHRTVRIARTSASSESAARAQGQRRLEQLAQERDFSQPGWRCEHGTDRIHVHSRAGREGSLVVLGRNSAAGAERRAKRSQRGRELDALVGPAHGLRHAEIDLVRERPLPARLDRFGIRGAGGRPDPRPTASRAAHGVRRRRRGA